MREYHKNGIVAYATVTIDGVLRFSASIRTYITETGEEKWFLSYPRRKQGNKWEDALILDEDLKEEVKKEVFQQLKEEIVRDLCLPEVDVTRITYINIDKELAEEMIVRAVATVEISGVTIKGITVKETRKGTIVNMPQYQTASGEYKDAVYGCVRLMQHSIRNTVLDAYWEGKNRDVPKFGTGKENE